MHTLIDFTQPEVAQQWQTVNDGVMGGISDGQFRITAHQTLQFFGTLSLANNGGFASVRTKPRELGLLPGDILVTRLRGEGRHYSMNFFINTPRIAFSYRAPLPTQTGEWIEMETPIASFEPTSFGQVIRNQGPVDPVAIQAIGFMLADRLPGPFHLEIEWVQVKR